jgi:hypothetical protein
MSITRFLTYYLPLVVKGSPPQWRVVCEEFKQDAENRINQCLAEHQKVL